jgi:membrane-associated protease RseP (regulator of RpoE activity)
MSIQSRIGWWVRGSAVPLLAVVLAGPIWGQDAEKKAPAAAAPPVAKVEEANAPASSYWLGILAAPADAILKTHLGIEVGVVVEQVVPESPAAKAGILVNDILLKFGDAELADVEGLQKAVGETKDREAKVTLLRAGKQTTVNVKPQVRPADLGLAAPVRPGDWGQITEMLKRLERGDFGEDPLRMFFIQPGVVVPKELKQQRIELFTSPPGALQLPKGTRVTVTRQNDAPTKITVEKDGQKWEVGEGELDKLPEDVRPAVKGMLGGGRVFVFGQSPVVVPGERPGRPGESKAPKAEPEKKPEGQQDAGGQNLDKVREKLEEMNRQLRENEKRMQKQMDELRQQLEKLGLQKI